MKNYTVVVKQLRGCMFSRRCRQLFDLFLYYYCYHYHIPYNITNAIIICLPSLFVLYLDYQYHCYRISLLHTTDLQYITSEEVACVRGSIERVYGILCTQYIL